MRSCQGLRVGGAEMLRVSAQFPAPAPSFLRSYCRESDNSVLRKEEAGRIPVLGMRIPGLE